MGSRWRGLLVAALVLSVVFAFSAGPVMAAEAVEPGDIPSVPELLALLAGPAGWVALGAFFSMVLERWQWYQVQDDVIKRGLPIVLAVVVSAGAQVALTYVDPAIWAAMAPYAVIVFGVLLTWLGEEAWFQAIIKPSRERAWREFAELVVIGEDEAEVNQ